MSPASLTLTGRLAGAAFFSCALLGIHADALRPQPKRESDPKAETPQQTVIALVRALPDGSPGRGLVPSAVADCAANCGIVFEPGQLEMDSVETGRLCFYLSAYLNAKVVDRTGLDGLYNVTLSWSPERWTSIFPAVRDQLGLRLEFITQ